MRHIGFAVSVEVETGDTSRLNVVADPDGREALGSLIGRKGERLSALQHLVNLMLSKRMGTWTRVLVDVEDYRGRRERQLRDLANRAAARVEETGKMIQLEPMPALERRWNPPRPAGSSAGRHPVDRREAESPDRRAVANLTVRWNVTQGEDRHDRLRSLRQRRITRIRMTSPTPTAELRCRASSAAATRADARRTPPSSRARRPTADGEPLPAAGSRSRAATPRRCAAGEPRARHSSGLRPASLACRPCPLRAP
jgi:hypothetical protein